VDRAALRQQGVRGAIFRGQELCRWVVDAMALLAALGLFAYLQRLRKEAQQRERTLDRMDMRHLALDLEHPSIAWCRRR
jgi:hypothetical protein